MWFSQLKSAIHKILIRISEILTRVGEIRLVFLDNQDGGELSDRLLSRIAVTVSPALTRWTSSGSQGSSVSKPYRITTRLCASIDLSFITERARRLSSVLIVFLDERSGALT
jgi:hypothetical protein